MLGLQWYFAAFIIVFRPARWYGSKFIPALAPLMYLGATASMKPGALTGNGGQGALSGMLAFALLLILAAAALATFTSSGLIGRQSRSGQFFVAASLYLPILVLLVVAYTAIDIPHSVVRNQSSWEVTTSGEPVELTSQATAYVSWTDKDGVVHTNEHPPIADKMMIWPTGFGGWSGRLPYPYFAGVSETHYAGLAIPFGQAWVVNYKKGLVAKYHSRLKRPVEVLYRDGSRANLAVKGFDRPFGAVQLKSDRILVVSPSILEIANVERRDVESAYMPPTGETIRGASPLFEGYPITPQDAKNQIAVVTNRRFIVLDNNCRKLISMGLNLPMQINEPLLSVSRLTNNAGYVLWPMTPSGGSTTVSKLDEYGRLVAQWHLYGLPVQDESVSNATGQSVLLRICAPVTGSQWRRPAASALAAFISLLLLLPIARRLRWSRARTAAWAARCSALGPALVLTVLCAYGWPALVPCSSCGKKRIVPRDLCEHCGARWPEPARDGTEIFGP